MSKPNNPDGTRAACSAGYGDDANNDNFKKFHDFHMALGSPLKATDVDHLLWEYSDHGTRPILRGMFEHKFDKWDCSVASRHLSALRVVADTLRLPFHVVVRNESLTQFRFIACNELASQYLQLVFGSPGTADLNREEYARVLYDIRGLSWPEDAPPTARELVGRNR